VRCSEWGGRQPEILDSQTLACVADASPDTFWLGLRQSVAAVTPDTGWTWPSGAAAGFVVWEAGQPEDGDTVEGHQEDCAVMADNESWRDVSCLDTSPYVVCELW
jgi:hypothetical protein